GREVQRELLHRREPALDQRALNIIMNNKNKLALAASAALIGSSAGAFTFSTDSVSGSFDSTLSLGIAVRLKAPACRLVPQGASGPDAQSPPAGCLAPTSGLGDQGDLNYGKHDPFALQLKGNHELLLKMPEDWTFLGRVNWVRDFAATNTTGIV